MREKQAFLLRDVLQRLESWRGRTVDVYVWEPATGWSFLGFRATIDDFDFDADVDGSGGRLEINFADRRHILILYADLIDDVEMDGRCIEMRYRGGNTEIALSAG